MVTHLPSSINLELTLMFWYHHPPVWFPCGCSHVSESLTLKKFHLLLFSSQNLQSFIFHTLPLVQLKLFSCVTTHFLYISVLVQEHRRIPHLPYRVFGGCLASGLIIVSPSVYSLCLLSWVCVKYVLFSKLMCKLERTAGSSLGSKLRGILYIATSVRIIWDHVAILLCACVCVCVCVCTDYSSLYLSLSVPAPTLHPWKLLVLSGQRFKLAWNTDTISGPLAHTQTHIKTHTCTHKHRNTHCWRYILAYMWK